MGSSTADEQMYHIIFSYEKNVSSRFELRALNYFILLDVFPIDGVGKQKIWTARLKELEIYRESRSTAGGYRRQHFFQRT